MRKGKMATGFKFRPKLSKIVELLLYLAHKRPDADKYQAVKFFYLADRLHLQRYGRPITNEDYFALWYGPVASNALKLIQGDKWVMQRAGLRQLPFETRSGTVRSKSGKETDTIFIGKPSREADLDLFSETDLEVFDEVLAQYGNATFEELYNITHEHFAYDHAWKTRKKGDRAEMYYDEMIEDEKQRAALIEDFGPIALRMK